MSRRFVRRPSGPFSRFGTARAATVTAFLRLHGPDHGARDRRAAAAAGRRCVPREQAGVRADQERPRPRALPPQEAASERHAHSEVMDRATLQVRRVSGSSEKKAAFVPSSRHQGRRQERHETCAAARCPDPTAARRPTSQPEGPEPPSENHLPRLKAFDDGHTRASRRSIASAPSCRRSTGLFTIILPRLPEAPPAQLGWRRNWMEHRHR